LFETKNIGKHNLYKKTNNKIIGLILDGYKIKNGSIATNIKSTRDWVILKKSRSIYSKAKCQN